MRALFGFGLFVLVLGPGPVCAQNSGAKLRPRPSATAARCGTGVPWHDDFAEALAEAKATGRMLFWYVPTVAGSPMDRTAEIDRYMMAGPFTSPDVVALLRDGFVCLRAPARGSEQREHNLRRQVFIEPGFLVLAPDGTEKARQDRIATLHPEWWKARLAPLAAAIPPPREMPPGLRAAWAAYAAGEDGAAESELEALAATEATPSVAAEVGFLRGAVAHRTRRADVAASLWRSVAERYPDEPFGWKAAAEVEGHGPFALGFEDYRALSPAALADSGAGSCAPAGAYDEGALRRRSVRFLLAMQQPDGGWNDSRYDFGGTDSLPNVYAAVTALAGMALLEEWAAGTAADREALAPALAAVRGHVCDDGLLNPDDSDEIAWAWVYRAHFAASWLDRRGADADVHGALARAASALQQLQSKAGAWYHEYPNPFVSASVLLALDDARAHGVSIDEAVVDRGVAALLRCRASNGAFTYGQIGASGSPRAAIPGAAGRMPLCELALARWRERDPQDIEHALTAAFEHHGLLEAVRKYDNHADAHGYGGFFFWYDVAARTRAIGTLADRELRLRLAAAQRAQIVAIAEFDGCFVDSHELGRVYGTASALLCLAWLRQMR